MSAQQRIRLNPDAPRAPMMGQGYSPDPTPSYRPNPISSGMDNAGGDGLVGQVQAWSSKAEDMIEAYTQVCETPSRQH